MTTAETNDLQFDPEVDAQILRDTEGMVHMPNDVPDDSTVYVSDVDHFIQLLAAWHDRKVAILEQMLGIPEGITVQVDQGKDESLSGDLHRGFIIGLSVALSELGTLPFAVEFEDEEEEAEAEADDALAAA